MTMCNVGGTDRTLRIVGGIGLLILGYFAQTLGITQTWQWTIYALGAISLVTGVITICPLYALLGLNTCKLPSQKQ